MRPQRKIMMVETTYAFVNLKQFKAAVSAGGIKFEHELVPRVGQPRSSKHAVVCAADGRTDWWTDGHVATLC